MRLSSLKSSLLFTFSSKWPISFLTQTRLQREMGIRDFFNSSTEAVKRNAPNFAPVKNACTTSYSYGSAACAKIDNTVRVKGLKRLKQWLPDDEAKSKIGIFAVKFAKNAGLYVLHEGYKFIPGAAAVSEIFTMTFKEVKRETLNEKSKPLENTDTAPGKQFTGTNKSMDRAEIQPGSLDHVNSIDDQNPADMIRIGTPRIRSSL
ncbi:Hypothetical predicted protein [Olea europaea subsp. europaea]|uniref:Uncharacterized protein n=2 Tax=Olea europaea subsp. europaea TaxID=158383 RepID=A0A8S0SEZ1_OLEEU|nr:Hypothetical predicted protein [Olea europaea subsp. europaea]